MQLNIKKKINNPNKKYAAAAAKSLQSCQTLCDPIDGSPPGSPAPGILQARTLEWVAISSSTAWKWKLKSEVAQSCPTLRDPMDCSPPGSSIHGIFQARVLEWGAIAFSEKIHRRSKQTFLQGKYICARFGNIYTKKVYRCQKAHEGVEKRELSHTLSENVNWYSR